MDHRLAHIPDPDPRMTIRTGTAERPTTTSRIAKLKPAQIGYQHIQSLTMNGQATTFQVDGTLLEVTLPAPIGSGKTSNLDRRWDARVREQFGRSGRHSAEGVALSMAHGYRTRAHVEESGWHLEEYVAREFVATLGSFDVSLHPPPVHFVGSSGVLQ